MPLTQMERIRLIETVMCEVSKLPYVGGYAAIKEVSEYLRASIEMPTIPVVSQHISTEQGRMLKGVGIILDDIRLVESKRSPNRALIYRGMIEILENIKYLKAVPDHKIILDMVEARDIFFNILEDKIVNPYAYLSTDTLDKIKNANILFIDTEWVFHPRNLKALTHLINYTNLSIADAFYFFKTLTIFEKDDLSIILDRHLNFARSSLDTISRQGGDLLARVKKIERFLLDASREVGSLPDVISGKFLNIVCTSELVDEYVKLSITHRLEDLQTVYSEIIEIRDTNMAQAVRKDLSNWLVCKTESKKDCSDKLLARYPNDLTTNPNALGNFVHTTLNLPTIEAISYTDAFATVLSCYSQEAANICHSMLGSAMNSARMAVNHIQITATNLLPATVEAGAKVITAVTASPNHKSSSSPYIIAGLMVAGVVSFSAVAYYCLFKPKKDKYRSLHVDADLAHKFERGELLQESRVLQRVSSSEDEVEHNAGKADAKTALQRRA